MEYRCIIVGDPVVEPYALLRRLLYDPFPTSEERALRSESLLDVRSREIRNAPLAPLVSPPPDSADRWSLTMSNPSMSEVDICIHFSVVTDPQRLIQLSTKGYSGRVTASGLYSQATADADDGVAGFTLYRPHCVVVCFNPFSLRSFPRMRAEWTHFLHFARQRTVSDGDRGGRTGAFSADSLLSLNQPNKSLIGSFFAPEDRRRTAERLAARAGDRSPASFMRATTYGRGPDLADGAGTTRLQSDYNHNPAPTVILVATRAELMRQAIESTPSIDVPNAMAVAETALWLQARAYAELDTTLEDTVDNLRMAIVQACVGELSDAPVVDDAAVVAGRQQSVARAIENMRSDPYGDPKSWDGGDEDDGRLTQPTGSETATTGEAITAATPAETLVTLLAPPAVAALPEESGTMLTTRDTTGLGTRWTYRLNKDSGRVFYVDRTTRRSQYQRPSGYDGREPPPASATSGSSSSSTATASDSSDSASSASSDADTQTATDAETVHTRRAAAHAPPASRAEPSGPLVPLGTDIEYGIASWDLQLVLSEMRRDKRERQERKVDAAVQRIAALQACASAAEKELARLAAKNCHLTDLRTQLESKQARAQRYQAESLARTEAEVARLRWDIESAGGGYARETAPSYAALADMGNQVQDEERDLAVRAERLQQRHADVRVLERAVQAASKRCPSAASRLHALMDEADGLAAQEAAVLRDERRIEALLHATMDAVASANATAPEPAATVRSPDRSLDAPVTVADYAHAMDVQSGEIQRAKVALQELRATVGPLTLTAAEENRRVHLSCQQHARGIARSAMTHRSHIEDIKRGAAQASALMDKIASRRLGQQALITSEEAALTEVLGGGKRCGGAYDMRSANVVAHLAQLRDVTAHFEHTERTKMRALRDTCRQVDSLARMAAADGDPAGLLARSGSPADATELSDSCAAHFPDAPPDVMAAFRSLIAHELREINYA